MELTMTGIKLMVFLLIISTAISEDADLVFENEDQINALDDVERDITSREDTGFGFIRGVNRLFDMLPTISSSSEEEIDKKDLSKNKKDKNRVIHRRFIRSPVTNDDEDEDGSTDNSGDYSISFQPRRESIFRVTFVVREPYIAAFSNRDSIPFQNLSRNLADGVNEILDKLPGEQRARLVRIQSRPEDNFTCKVTLEIHTDQYDTEKIQGFIKTQIENTGRLGKVIASAEEFTVQTFAGARIDCAPEEESCLDGSCFLRSKRCDGVYDCADNSDELACDTEPTREEITEHYAPRETTTEIQETTPPESPDIPDYENGGLDTPLGPFDKNENERITSPPERPRCRADDQVRCPDSSVFICEDQKCDANEDCPDGSDEKDCYTDEDKRCAKDEMNCDLTRCVPLSKVCDRQRDCTDGTDEQDCVCDVGDFKCHNGLCIESVRRCDGVADCYNGEDEQLCPCQSNEYRCGDGSCIETRKQCDGVDNCRDGSDEQGCGTPCDERSFQCSNGSCIPNEELCNGYRDCPDGEDELDCEEKRCDIRCGDGECFDGSKRCDQVLDCLDGTDEEGCGYCRDNEFRCNNGDCISKGQECDGTADCTDQSDEINCEACGPNTFRCLSDGSCIDKAFYCDNHPDCEDGSDESDCSDPLNCIDGMLCDDRCVESSDICNGVRDCSDGRDEINCPNPESQCASFEYECSDHSCIFYNLVCNGISDCRDGSDELECGYNKECRPDEWQCTTGECININNRCDGREDCPDGSDEKHPSCQVSTTMAPITRPPYVPPITQRPPWSPPGGLELKTYPNEQIIKQSPYRKGGEVVFQCRDEGSIRAPVKWVKQGGRPLPPGSTDINGRLEMPNIQVSDSGIYICQTIGYNSYPGNELSVQLTVQPYVVEIGRPSQSCKEDEATCSNGNCIPKHFVCNGNYDCSDRSDEMGCNVHGLCEPNEFKCSNKRCVLKTWVCDSEDDCRDGSDEANCIQGPPGAPCRPHEFQCKSGNQCIPRSFHCDKETDCLDGSDEIGCSPVYISRVPPPMKILAEHSIFEVTCVAIGIPTPQIVWRLNWGHIPSKCSYTSVDGMGTLTCPDIRIEDQGAYSCEALNSFGSAFAVPDTILVVNSTTIVQNVCPAGYFNNEARVVQECISCFCFGATSECKSADLFTYQLQPPLNRGGSRLVGVIKPPNQALQITDEPISDIFEFTPDYRGATITRIGMWSPRNIYPYLALPETYHGTQLTSYGGYIKYTVRSQTNYPPPYGYSPLPDVIIKGGNIILTHSIPYGIKPNQDNDISVQLFQGQWKKVTPYDSPMASREEIMMVLAKIEAILLRAEESGSGIEIKNFQMDSATGVNTGQGSAAYVEECKCPQGYSGLSCQNCSPGFKRVESGQWLGRCVREEEPCQVGYYGNPSNGVPCRLCPCPLTNPANQFSRTCQLVSDGQVTCDCPIGYLGRRCETCAPGYVGNPTIPGDSCRPAPRPSHCDPSGTASQDNGLCRCKSNVGGSRCSECVENAFNLSPDNIHGCSQCFCMGVTRSCTSSTWRRSVISAKFGSQSLASSVKLVEWDDNTDSVRYLPSESLEADADRQEVRYNQFDYNSPATYYWSLPERFGGEQLTAYGGYLNYTIRHVSLPGAQFNRDNSPDIQLIGKNDITLVHYSQASPDPNGLLQESVQLLEQYWQREDGVAMDRGHFLMALTDIESVLIKATYTTDSQEVALVAASMQNADRRGTGERASHVEECQCPLGYVGISCQHCAPGYTRVLEGLYLGFCQLCSCNDHSDECHPETGDCMNCQHNTQGPTCDECLPGYEGDATSGSPGACRSKPEDQLQCRCDVRGTQSPFCVGGPSRCRCKQNVDGERCDQCRPGTFKLAESNPQGCSSCYCSGVTDQCSEAQHLYRQQIPTAIIDESHGFIMTTLDQEYVIEDNFQLNIPLNQISYNFGGRPSHERIYWSLPATFNGNKVTSYGGQISITQKFDCEYNEFSSDDMDVVLVGRTNTIYWKNPQHLRSGISLTYAVPLNEAGWFTMSTGEAPRPISRSDMLSVLSDLRMILIRATLSPTVETTYIGDVAMDTAIATSTGQPIASNIEVCRCPVGHSGTSCETCSSGYYRSASSRCERCPCSNREEGCHLGSKGQVVCECRPGYTGPDCSSTDFETTTQVIATGRPTPNQPSIQVKISAPTVENQPIGGRVQFICTAWSPYYSSSSRVQWSKEGGSLPLGRAFEDASRGILSIQDLKVSDSGTYICQASDGISVGMDRASLTVPRNEMNPPQVSLYPTSIEVTEGDVIEIRCEATGNPTPTLSWYRVNSKAMNVQHTFVDGIFRISSARPSDQGDYRCTASNSVGQDSKPAVVYVNPRPEVPERPPMLSVNPSQPIVREGDSLTIVCSADRNVPSNLITWTRDGADYIPSNFRSQNGQLWMENIHPEDAGVYRCSAEQFVSRVIPASVILTVQRHPQPTYIQGSVKVNVTSITIPEGQSFTVKCEPKGSPLPIIKWTKDGSEFGSSVSQRGNALVISHAKLSDRGVYVCIGSTIDDVPIAQDSTMIEVERRQIPEVIVWPEGVQIVQPGSTIHLQCRVVSGTPTPVILWSRPSGRPLSTNAHLRANDILSFEGITINDEGVYTCTASNAAGEGSANVTIKINSPPVLTISPDTYINAQPGKELILECRASGYPEPYVHWAMVSPEEKKLTADTPGSAMLRLPSVGESDEGTYSCIARNEAGVRDEKVQVTVLDNEIDSVPLRGDIPGPKVSISNNKNITIREGESLRIDCKKRNEQTYEIIWSKIGTRQYLKTQNYADGSLLILENLIPQDSGTYRCEGYDRENHATFDEVTIHVVPDVPPPPPPSSYPRPNSNTNTNSRPDPNEQMQNDWQVHSAVLGSSVAMPCVTNLPTPVSFQWERPHGQLPPNVQARSHTLQLSRLNESDAGPYTCKVSHGNLQMESHVILKVTHVVPRFSGDGFLAFRTLQDAYLYFDIEIAIKPQDYNGIILYNAESDGPTGDMVSLALLNGIPEFRFLLRTGLPVIITGDQPLSLDQWHNIKISRSSKDGYMYVDGRGPFTGSAPDRPQGLDLNEPLYIGGIPSHVQIPEDFQPKTGFVGCIGRLLLENREVHLMRESMENMNVDQCDSCSENPCQNGGFCQDALTNRGYTCICSEGYSEFDCSRTGDSCRPGLCGPGRCTETMNGFQCNCPIGFAGQRCESSIEIEYPAFSNGAFLAFASPKTSRHLKMSLKVKPNYPIKDGLILYCAESRHGHGDFTSLTLNGGYLEFRFGSAKSPAIIKSLKPLVPNQWTDIVITRVSDKGKLAVQNQESVTGGTPSNKTLTLTLKTPLYVGGYDSDWLTVNKGAGVDSGFNGCITDVKISDVKMDIVNSLVKSANVRECGANDSDYRPHRGDIPETNPPYSTEGVCQWCKNNGYCMRSGDQRCVCPTGFSGVLCEIAQATQVSPLFSPCDSHPCENGGTCRPTRAGTLYQCDCPKGTGGFQCKQRVELGTDVSLTGEGYVELPASFLPHDNPKSVEVIAIAFTTTSPDGLLIFQGENGANFKDGDFIMLTVNGGFVELQWNLGEGVGTITNTRILVSDGERHEVVVKRTATDATLEVDNMEDHGRGPGITQMLNADSNIYVGGLPSNMSHYGVIGFAGCITQVEFQDSAAINLGQMAVASRNANPCLNS